MQQLFSQHLARVQRTVQTILEQSRLDGLWIYAGEAKTHFLDDLTAPFKINPHFNYIFPFPQAEKSWLFLDGKHKPKIYFYAPKDYWHVVATPPQDAFFAAEFDWQLFSDSAQVPHFVQNTRYAAFLGEDVELAASLGFEQVNPQKVLNVLHFERSIKSEFEIACIYQAQFNALKGHHAAKQAFFAGKSEFEINLEYLRASQQSDLNVPYGNIVALNQHSAILHYTELDSAPPAEHHSFLIDAGASFMGYASDLTRTYAFDEQGEFGALIAKMEAFKTACIANLTVGVNYLQYHTQMHQWIAKLLHEFDFVRLSPEQIFEEGITRQFFPHGLGHQLGLQVHDVAGFQQNARGTRKPAPEAYPSLRCTRDLAEGMVLTIEPGFYFVDMLLNPQRRNRAFNWEKIDAFRKFGGIRTEDNVVVRANGAENLTAKAAQQLHLD